MILRKIGDRNGYIQVLTFLFWNKDSIISNTAYIWYLYKLKSPLFMTCSTPFVNLDKEVASSEHWLSSLDILFNFLLSVEFAEVSPNFRLRAWRQSI
jgi:hypothetical protein